MANGGEDVITLKDLNSISEKSFPLCAKNLFRKVKEAGPLKTQAPSITFSGLNLRAAILCTYQSM